MTEPRTATGKALAEYHSPLCAKTVGDGICPDPEGKNGPMAGACDSALTARAIETEAVMSFKVSEEYLSSLDDALAQGAALERERLRGVHAEVFALMKQDPEPDVAPLLRGLDEHVRRLLADPEDG